MAKHSLAHEATLSTPVSACAQRALSWVIRDGEKETPLLAGGQAVVAFPAEAPLQHQA